MNLQAEKNIPLVGVHVGVNDAGIIPQSSKNTTCIYAEDVLER
jgi:hypothetical protein